MKMYGIVVEEDGYMHLCYAGREVFTTSLLNIAKDFLVELQEWNAHALYRIVEINTDFKE